MCRVLVDGNLLLLLLSLLRLVGGDFGDYEDTSFNCPAFTTCPIACVANVNDCPAGLLCDSGESLCVDGTCVPAGESCGSKRNNPCRSDCTPIACAKVDDYYESCFEKYNETYTYATVCAEEEEAANTREFTFRESGFDFCYAWISIMTVAVIGWCAFNQRYLSFVDSTKSLEEAEESSSIIESSWTQTAYRRDVMGDIIYALVCVTLFGFHILLGVLTVLYYIQQDAIHTWSPVFEDVNQVLKAFEITWVVGFIWSFSLKWPYNVRSLFLRRCLLVEATHVAVFAPTSAPGREPSDPGYISKIKWMLYMINFWFNSFMSFIFSYVDRPKGGGKFKYCPVEVDADGHRYFYFRLRRYNFDLSSGTFVPGVADVGTTVEDFCNAKDGLDNEEVTKRRSIIGPNTIPMKKPNLFKSIVDEFTKPFYTYQSFMVWTWFPLWYYYMALVNTVVIITGGLVVSFFHYRNEQSLYKLTHVSGNADALRDGTFVTVPLRDIVPGDVIVPRPGATFCDMVVIASANILVDESALTGESTPMAKTAIDFAEGSKAYDPKTHKKNTIFAGTTILESSETDEELAVVTKTGSFTAKGELLRDILSYERRKFQFDTEVEIVIIILFCYAIVCFSLVIYFLEYALVYAWFYGMYVVGTCLPPLLPTVFTVSVGISDNRLSSKRIACSNSQGILVAGRVRTAFFDKTGTLTKQGLDFLSAKSSDAWASKDVEAPSGILASGMACCHTLTMSNEGLLIGNSVDSIMFHAVGANLNHVPGNGICVTESDGKMLTVLKRFDFDHHRMTQSVIVRNEDGKLIVFVKGSGESIKQICQPQSLPDDFDRTVRACAREGIYQISMAMKYLPMDENLDLANISRGKIEKDLIFAGVVNFKNALREDTPEVIQHLEEGGVQSIMVTGDSVLTGICIAKESGILKPFQQVLLGQDIDPSTGDIIWVDEFDQPANLPALVALQSPSSNIGLAVTGAAWTAISEKSFDEAIELAQFIRVYGRCTPNDKVSVVSAFIRRGHVTLMCGDGGNDCGALKTAHVGIALSDAEASVVSPFTSLDKSISSVVEVLKEGRCALASALASYKYMIIYGQVETLNQLINAYLKISFSEWCWAFMDGFWLITMAFTLPLAKAEKTLSPKCPTSSLLGKFTMSSAIGVLAFNFMFTLIAMSTLFNQDWFQCRKWRNTDVSDVLVLGDNYEAEVLFLVTGYQYISTAMAFNFGYKYREAWIKNTWFVFFAMGYTLLHIIVTLVPSSVSCLFRVNCSNENALVSVVTLERMPINNAFNTTVMPVDFRWILISIMAANTITTMCYEFFIVNGWVGQQVVARLTGKKSNGVQSVQSTYEMGKMDNELV